MRLTFKSIDLGKSRSPSMTWVGPIKPTEGLKREKIDLLQESGDSASRLPLDSDCSPSFPLLARPTDFGWASLHNHMTQFFKIPLGRCEGPVFQALYWGHHPRSHLISSSPEPCEAGGLLRYWGGHWGFQRINRVLGREVGQAQA